MPLRKLSESELAGLKKLTDASVEATLLQPTWTGLDKGYMDATKVVRDYLKEKNIHDYATQGRGAAANGVKLEAHLLSETRDECTSASLYKPEAKPNKDGDPRIWFYGLKRYAQPDDMLAVVAHDGKLFAINLTQIDVSRVTDGPIFDLLREISADAGAIARELLGKLRAIAARGLLRSVMAKREDTAIGRTLEDALGIAMNSKKLPDYKGIELKSSRQKNSRKQLFAKVPDWKISRLNGSTDILDAFGYHRAGRDRLNCTVSASSVNPQGLTFEIDEDSGLLNEVSTIKAPLGAFATWRLSDLRSTLAEKHAETFWVSATSHDIGGREHFDLKGVIHTRKPIVSQFHILVEQGAITMDHLMKRLDSGRADEGGPSFKVAPKSLDLLFPRQEHYDLV